MYVLKYSGKMKKDLKLCQKKNFDFLLLQKVIEKLMIPEPLEMKNKDHSLSGNYVGYRECHITPDWLLVYRHHNQYLELYRTGTHSDLFR